MDENKFQCIQIKLIMQDKACLQKNLITNGTLFTLGKTVE